MTFWNPSLGFTIRGKRTVRKGDLSGRERFNGSFDESLIVVERIVAVATIYIVALLIISRELGRTDVTQQL